MKTIIKNGTVFTPQEVIQNGWVVIEDGCIVSFGGEIEIGSDPSARVIDAEGNRVIPGLIDTHIHGAGGFDMTGGDCAKAAEHLPSQGITSFLATTHFLIPHDELVQAVSEIASIIGKPQNGANILGIHMEGPWIAAERSSMGTQGLCYPLTRDDIGLFQQTAKGTIRMITFAPEQGNSIDVIPFLKELNIIPSIGHSNADYEFAMRVIGMGINHSTHTLNGMVPMHQRKPGLVAALLNSPSVLCELISDGFNVQPPVMQILIKIKGIDNVCLISDALPINGMLDGSHIFWDGFDIYTNGIISTLKDGSPAGAYKLLNYGLKVIAEETNIPLKDAIYMASTVPARMLGIMKGQIKAGYDADIVILGDDYDPVKTMIGGRIVYER
jgi:N-acetylglucosamine-6-phosphate deacetylase